MQRDRPLWEGEPIYNEVHNTAVIKVRDFSNADVHTHDWDESDERDLKNSYCIEVYPKGYDRSTKDHVSLKFRLNLWGHLHNQIMKSMISHLELTCVVAVVDSVGCRRFRQSFALLKHATEGIMPFFVDKYISRDFLMTDADDLLPDDTLTLQLDMVLRVHYAVDRYRKVDFDELWTASLKTEEGSSKYHCLLLESPLAERLRKEAKYFQRLCATPMSEKDSGYVKIPDEELDTFLGMVKILWKLAFYDIDLCFSVEQILDMYVLADFYGIDSVIDTCRCWLRIVCRTGEDASGISRLADLHGDHILEEIAEAYPGNEAELEVQEKNNVQHEPWTYEPFEYDLSKDPIQVSFYFDWRKGIKWKERESVHVTDDDVSDMSNCYI